MKRRHKEEYDHIYDHYSFFSWKQCCICKQDFKRESGYRFIAGPYYRGSGRWYYLCKECAPTRKEAYKVYKNRSYLPKTKPPPPPPPSPKRVHDFDGKRG